MRSETFGLHAFGRLEHDWDELASAYPQAPFLGVDFVRALIETFATGAERLVRISSEGRLVAMGIFVKRGPMWQTFQPSQSPIGCLVVRPGTEWEPLLDAFARALPGWFLGVAASQQDPQSTPRPDSRGRLSTLDHIETPYIEIAGTFGAYWDARGRNLRHNLRKQRRKLADEGIEVRLELITAPSEVEQAVAQYAALESAGWKAQLGTAIGLDNSQGRFYRRMMEAYCAKGRGRIYRYHFDGRVVVIDLCIESDDTLVMLKTTYDESIGRYSAASLMREEVFRALWAEGRLKRIEIFGRKTEWASRWADHSRMLYHVNWYRWPSLMQLGSSLARRLRPTPGGGVLMPPQ